MYINSEFIELIPGLGKTLKGTACFNVRKPRQVNEKELALLMKKGVNAWKKMGFME